MREINLLFGKVRAAIAHGGDLPPNLVRGDQRTEPANYMVRLRLYNGWLPVGTLAADLNVTPSVVLAWGGQKNMRLSSDGRWVQALATPTSPTKWIEHIAEKWKARAEAKAEDWELAKPYLQDADYSNPPDGVRSWAPGADDATSVASRSRSPSGRRRRRRRGRSGST